MRSVARWTIPPTRAASQAIAAFARARFELIARPRQSLEAAIKVARDAGYEIIDLGADLEGEAREVAADHARLALKARARRQAHRDPLRRRAHRDRARQRPRRPEPGICAGAGRTC